MSVSDDANHMLALALALPEYVYLETVTGIRIDDEFLAAHGFGPDTYDLRWMQLPINVQVGWKRVEKPVHRAVELAFVAADALDEFVRYSRDTPIAGSPPELPEATTVAVCVFPVLDPDAAKHQQHGLLDVMTLAHCIVSDAVRSVRLVTGIPLRDLTYKQLSPIVPTLVGSRDTDGSVTWGDTAVVMLQHHLMTLMSGEPLPPEAVELTRQVVYQFTISRAAVVVRDHVGRADSLAEQGDYAGAIVSFATACEVSLDNLLSALLWESGHSPSEAAAGWNISAATRAKTRFAPLLGGNWNFTTSMPLKAWMTDVARPRHRIVHAGGNADGTAAERARTAADRLFAFLAERLVQRGREYPKTVSMLLGHDSIRRFGGAQVEVLLAAHEEHNDTWEREFRDWRRRWMDNIWA